MVRKLFKLYEHSGSMTIVHSVEGTTRLVLELELFGVAYASRYILLKSNTIIERLKRNDARVLDLIRKGGSGLGRVLKDADLRYVTAERCMGIVME